MTLKERMEWEGKFERWLRENSTKEVMPSSCLATVICWMLETRTGAELVERLCHEIFPETRKISFLQKERKKESKDEGYM